MLMDRPAQPLGPRTEEAGALGRRPWQGRAGAPVSSASLSPCSARQRPGVGVAGPHEGGRLPHPSPLVLAVGAI